MAVLDREGQGGTLIFSHANGLNASAYAPFLDALAADMRIVAVSARGHGATKLPTQPDRLRSWDIYAEDLEGIVRATDGPAPLTLAGHSLGAVTSLLAAARGVETERLLLIEPVILPGIARMAARTPGAGKAVRANALAVKAARRRNGWPDRQSVFEQYSDNAFFARWDERALRRYLEEGLQGEGPVSLACDPAWEAATFGAQAHRFWRPLMAVRRRGVPVHVLRAQERSTVPERTLWRLRMLGVKIDTLPGSHMLPQEMPEEAARWMAERLTLAKGLTREGPVLDRAPLQDTHG